MAKAAPPAIRMPGPIEMVALGDLVPSARNARTHSPEQVGQIAEAMRKWGWTNPVLINASGGIIAGHGRVLAAELLTVPEAPCIRLSHLSEAEERALMLADNKLALNAGWDDEMLAAELRALADLDIDLSSIGFDDAELAAILAIANGDPATGGGAALGNLTGEFLIAPFTVLNAREGWWQDRKRAWIALGIESEVGRGENLLSFSDTMLEPDPAKRAAMIAARKAEAGRARNLGQDLLNGEGRLKPRKGGKPGTSAGMREQRAAAAKSFGTQDWVQQKIAAGEIEGGMAANQSGTSIFDPVLCELVYRWFAPPGGLVLDPFAGGSVRGIVAAQLGRRYIGIELRPEQVEANHGQWAKIGGRETGDAEWREGDSSDLLPLDPENYDGPADFVFSCPPYGDLEVYSDLAADLSTMDDAEFLIAYERIIRRAIDSLKPDRFACFVVGDYRDKRGLYRNFVSRTIAAFEAAGARLYNEAILVTSVGSLPMRAAKQFRTTRKLGKTHQNVLVFVKGDPKKATEACGPVDVAGALTMFGGDLGLADEPEADAPPAPPPKAGQLGAGEIKVSAAMARLLFLECGPECISATGCKGNCCDAPSRPTGCMITVHPDEQARIEALGGVVEAGLLQPRVGERGCPFKSEGLCGLHASGEKPWGCIASPFTLNTKGTLIVRNRYRLLPCFKGEGSKRPAYHTFRSSLEIIFGESETARIVAHLDAGGGDLIAKADPAIKARLGENDAIKRAAKAEA